MKVTGEQILQAPVPDVWQALTDPTVLARTLPGCERFEAIGPDRYALTVRAGVGSIKGSYAADVRLAEQREPSSFVLVGSGSGAPGTVNTTVAVKLADAGGGATRLTYDADAVVGGMIAGVGQRMLAAVATRLAGEFFTAVEQSLIGEPTVAVPVAGTQAERPVPSAPRVSYVIGFRHGVVFGAGVALAGVIVGALLGRRRRA